MLFFVLLLSILNQSICQSLDKIGIGFPETWNGDKYGVLDCPATNIPTFIDGYFLCQLSASYGNNSNPNGQKLINLIDAIGAVGGFHIQDGKVTFTAQYYPAKPYKMWDFYGRDMAKATVSWHSPFSYYNQTSMNLWDSIPQDQNMADIHSNVAFWKVGNNVIGGTEEEFIGYQFDIHALTDFMLFPFIEENSIFNNDTSDIIPMNVAVHEHMDPDGTIWAGFSAIGRENMHYYQGILTVDTNGVRRVVGLHDYGQFDPKNCAPNGTYHGDPRLLAGYMHSITATQNYIILPVTSILFNPCDSPANPNATIQAPDLNGMVFFENVGIRFLIFDKRNKSFITQTPLETKSAMYVTHQLNAYEINDDLLVADMIPYPNDGPYSEYMYLDFLLANGWLAGVGATRFSLDLSQKQINVKSLIPQPNISIEFPQINHAYQTKNYSWGYIVQNPYAAGNSILKINVNDPSGKQNLVYKAKNTMIVHEPQFLARPDAVDEDDGVLIIRGQDVESEKAQLIIIDAKTMTEIGNAEVPISIPFGFHNRFFSSASQSVATTTTSPPPSSPSHNIGTSIAPSLTYGTALFLFKTFMSSNNY